MAIFLYRCPNTGQQVQGWIADDPTEDDPDDDTDTDTDTYRDGTYSVI